MRETTQHQPGDGPTAMTRRGVLLATLACVACGESFTRSADAAGAALPVPLRRAAPFPVGSILSTEKMKDAAYLEAFQQQFSQFTPEWEMKMGPMLTGDGRLVSEKADMLAAFASAQGLAMHGTTLVWYKNPPPYFQKLAGDKAAFAKAYGRYIREVTERFAGVARGWDVVNEPLTDEGELRDCLWSRTLGGESYIRLAFDHAAAGDPKAVRFLNEYDLERKPKKRAAFLRLVERQLKAGAKIGGLGSQSHIDIDTDPAEIALTIKELAQFGLPVHVSELDISTARGVTDLRSDAAKLEQQAEVARALAGAFVALPPAQRYAFTLWGFEDADSWLLKPPMAGIRGGTESPLAFSAGRRPKPMAQALAEAFSEQEAG